MTQNEPVSVSDDSRNSYRSNWSAAKFALSGFFILIAVALVFQGVIYIGDGVGALVPYLMIVIGPTLAVYYIWFLLFRAPDQDTE